MTNITETISAFKDACVKHDLPPHPIISVVLDIIKNEGVSTLKSSSDLYLAGNNTLLGNINRLNDLHAALLLTWLEYNTYIVSLDLRYNSITDDGANSIAILIRTNQHIEKINLMCNDFEEEGARLLSDALKTNQTLRELRINGNKIGNKGGLYFAEALQVNSTLEALDLSDTDLKAESLVALSTVLCRNSSLKALNIGRPLLTSLQEESTDHFARMLKVNRSLQELHMSKHGMMDFGAIRLADDLMHNSTLVYLNLYCNKISSDGAKQLAEMLKCNKTLRILDLGCNRIGDKGAEYIAEALGAHNKTLVSLDVRQNAIRGSGLCSLADCLTPNLTLTQLYIWGNDLQDESGCTAFKNLLMTGRLAASNTDVEPYTVDGRAHLAQLSNGLRSWYYWGPWYGENALPELTKFIQPPNGRPNH